MDHSLEKSVSISMESTSQILSYLPRLVSDLWALGSSPEVVVDLVRPLQLIPEQTMVLDLGCGKGAVSITLAKELNFYVVGVDACKAFLDDAKRQAEELNVSENCQFIVGDIREYVKQAKNFDLVIYASLGNVLGNFAECVGQLRTVVRNGGYILIDDGFLKYCKRTNREGYEHYCSHGQTLKLLTGHGDTLVREFLLPDEQHNGINWHYLEMMKMRAKEIAEEKPEISELLWNYIRNQHEECEFIEKNISGAIWLLQKNKSKV